MLASSYACLMVDTTSLGCFSIMTEIIYSETGGNKYQADVFWYMCASDQLVSIFPLPVRKYNKQSHYTSVQSLPLHWCNVFHFSVLHDLGLLVTFQNTLPLLQRRRDLPSNLLFSFTVHFLFAEEGCNHVVSWFLFLSAQLLSISSSLKVHVSLTLDHAFWSLPDVLQSLHGFFDSETQIQIEVFQLPFPFVYLFAKLVNFRSRFLFFFL